MLSLEKDEALGKVHEQMLCAAESLEKLVSLWDGASTILTAAEYEESLALGKAFLDAYLFLHHWSGKGQMQLPHSGKAPHIHPLAVEFEVPKPQNAVVLQRGRLCGPDFKAHTQHQHGCLKHKAELESSP